MSLLIVLAISAAVLAYLGRSSTPPHQRHPLRTSTAVQLARDVRRGVLLISAHSPLEGYIDELTGSTTPSGAGRERVLR